MLIYNVQLLLVRRRLAAAIMACLIVAARGHRLAEAQPPTAKKAPPAAIRPVGAFVEKQDLFRVGDDPASNISYTDRREQSEDDPDDVKQQTHCGSR
jgi:hypothetical protein